MKKRKRFIIFILILLSVGGIGVYVNKHYGLSLKYNIGDPIDSLNHVKVYYNGGFSHVGERNTVDGYNIGLKYQCVEFVKRYYFEFYKHRMPDPYGNAIDFYNSSLADGAYNSQRDLIQYTNPSKSKPQVGDLLILDKTSGNEFGHVCIVSQVTPYEIEIIQQNAGNFGNTRKWYDLDEEGQTWHIEEERVLGWLRMK